MAPDVSTLAPHTPSQHKLPFRWWWLLPMLAGALLIAGVPRALESPTTVSKITLVNHTKYAMDVDVTGAQRDGWMGLGTAEREATTAVHDVIDQGGTWIFRFKSQGLAGGELQLTKDDLKQSGWRVTIPDEVGAKLATAGAPPTPTGRS